MTVIVILATLGAILWTLLVLAPNGKSLRPTDSVDGFWTIPLAWIICGSLWFAWWWG